MKNRSKESLEERSHQADVATNLFALFHQIILVVSDLSAGCLRIDRVVGYCRRHNFKQFQNFLQVLEAYGTGYDDDIDYRNYKIRDKVSHR